MHVCEACVCWPDRRSHESGVFFLQLLKSLGLVGLQTAVLLQPAVVRLHHHAELLAGMDDCLSLRIHDQF